MTPEQLREAAQVMLAAADGKVIESKPRKDFVKWTIPQCPSWDWSIYVYRIKPEPRKVKVKLVSLNGSTAVIDEDSWPYFAHWKPVSDIVEIEVKE